MSQQQEDLITKLITSVTNWHGKNMKAIEQIIAVPEGTKVQLGADGTDPLIVEGDMAIGFNMGMRVCKEWFGTLPFTATKNDDEVSSEVVKVQHVYLFTEDLGDGSNAVRYTQDAGLLRRLQDDDHEECDSFAMNEGYSDTLTFPADIDLKKCGFDFYQE